MAKNPFYVYALKDPRINPAKAFYIGKGSGNRAWEHELINDNSEKGIIIQAIKNSGLEVIHTIIADDLNEVQALKIEAELISAYGIISKGGLLTNVIQPNLKTTNKKIIVNVPEGCYEKAQLGLKFIKEAIIEFVKANPTGIKNADSAKYLGLHSDYGGGSKDYLSYSILGILLKEGKIERFEGALCRSK